MKNRIKNVPFWATNNNNVLVVRKREPDLVSKWAKEYFPFMLPMHGMNCVVDLIKWELSSRVVYES